MCPWEKNQRGALSLNIATYHMKTFVLQKSIRIRFFPPLICCWLYSTRQLIAWTQNPLVLSTPVLRSTMYSILSTALSMCQECDISENKLSFKIKIKIYSNSLRLATMIIKDFSSILWRQNLINFMSLQVCAMLINVL